MRCLMLCTCFVFALAATANPAVAADDSDWICHNISRASTTELRLDHCALPPTRQGIRLENLTDDRRLKVVVGRCTFTPVGTPDIVTEGWEATLEPGQSLIHEKGYPPRTEAHAVDCEPPQISRVD